MSKEETPKMSEKEPAVANAGSPLQQEEKNIPEHVAIILDGNGRWAKAQGKPRVFGHKKGAENVQDMLFYAGDIGIKYLTVYVFSTENWNRPGAEVSAIMGMLAQYCRKNVKISMDNNVRCKMIGDRTRLSDEVLDAVTDLERITAANTGMTFTMAINYGGRDEIRRAVKKIAEKVKAGELEPDAVTEALIAENLDTAELPDPDLLIRTCNEQRVSNFLLWQLAYTEFYFTQKAWPEFDREELEKAVAAYSGRTRKFGALKN